MLPSTLIPTGYIDVMRATANQFFTESVSAYESIISYDDYGQEILASGLRFTTSGYVGRVGGRDQELLESLRLEGSETDTTILILVPLAFPIRITDTIVTQNTDYRVVWSNEHTQDSVQLYQKAICARKVILPEQRYNRG